MSEDEWTLVTVTYGGEVHSSRHASRYDAENAKHMALHGCTLEQQAKYDEEARRRAAEIKASWEAEHPPRKPTTSEVQEWTERCEKFKHSDFDWRAYQYWTIEPDGLMHQHYRREGCSVSADGAIIGIATSGSGAFSSGSRLGDIKWAECFPSRPSTESRVDK